MPIDDGGCAGRPGRNEAHMNSPRETAPTKGAQPKPHKRVGRGATPTGRRDDSTDVTTRLPRIGEDGRVADFGTHEELLSRCAGYRRAGGVQKLEGWGRRWKTR